MGIGGSSTFVSIIIFQVPFNYLYVIIDVYFPVIEKIVPTLLSMKDILENSLDIWIEGQYVNLGEHYLLTMENFSVIHRWYPKDMLYALYTK